MFAVTTKADVVVEGLDVAAEATALEIQIQEEVPRHRPPEVEPQL